MTFGIIIAYRLLDSLAKLTEAARGPGDQIFVFNHAVNALSKRVIGGLLAHTYPQLSLAQQLQIAAVGILSASIGVVDTSLQGGLRKTLQRHLESFDIGLGSQAFAGCPANHPTGVNIDNKGQVVVIIPNFKIGNITLPYLVGPADETSFYQVLKDLMGWNGSTHGVFRALEPVAQLTENPTELIAAYAFGSQLPVELFESLAGMLGPPLVDAADKPIDQLQMGRLAPEMLPDGLLADRGGLIHAI